MRAAVAAAALIVVAYPPVAIADLLMAANPGTRQPENGPNENTQHRAVSEKTAAGEAAAAGLRWNILRHPPSPPALRPSARYRVKKRFCVSYITSGTSALSKKTPGPYKGSIGVAWIRSASAITVTTLFSTKLYK
jgi:hypothetical protein